MFVQIALYLDIIRIVIDDAFQMLAAHAVVWAL